MWPFVLMLLLFAGAGKIKFISDSETSKYLSYKNHIKYWGGNCVLYKYKFEFLYLQSFSSYSDVDSC